MCGVYTQALVRINNRVNWKGTIATFKSWRYNTTTSNIGDMLLPYVFQHLRPTRRVRIPLAFSYGPYCPSVRCSSHHRYLDRFPAVRRVDALGAAAGRNCASVAGRAGG